MSSYEGLTVESLANNASGYVAPAIRCLANAINDGIDERRYLEVKSVKIPESEDIDSGSGEEDIDLTNFTFTGVDTDTGLVYKIYRKPTETSTNYYYIASVVGATKNSDFTQGLFVPRTITFEVSGEIEEVSGSILREARVTTFDSVTFSRYRSGDNRVIYGDWIYAPWVEIFNAGVKLADTIPITVPFTKIEFPRCKTFTATEFVENSDTISSGDVWMNLNSTGIKLIDFSAITKVPISHSITNDGTNFTKDGTMSGMFNFNNNVSIDILKLGVGICGYDIRTSTESTNPYTNKYFETPFNVFTYSTETTITKTITTLIFISSEFGSTCYHSGEEYAGSTEIPNLSQNTGNATISTGTTITNAYIPRIVTLQSRMGNDQLLAFYQNMFCAQADTPSSAFKVNPDKIIIY